MPNRRFVSLCSSSRPVLFSLSRTDGFRKTNTSDRLYPFLAKFTGYQYGGRPLGLSYVKYVPGGADAMEGAQAVGSLTQDQIM